MKHSKERVQSPSMMAHMQWHAIYCLLPSGGSAYTEKYELEKSNAVCTNPQIRYSQLMASAIIAFEGVLS